MRWLARIWAVCSTICWWRRIRAAVFTGGPSISPWMRTVMWLICPWSMTNRMDRWSRRRTGRIRFLFGQITQLFILTVQRAMHPIFMNTMCCIIPRSWRAFLCTRIVWPDAWTVFLRTATRRTQWPWRERAIRWQIRRLHTKYLQWEAMRSAIMSQCFWAGMVRSSVWEMLPNWIRLSAESFYPRQRR